MPCSSGSSGNCRVFASTEVPENLPTTHLQAQGSAYGLTTCPNACALWGVTGCHLKGDLEQDNVCLENNCKPVSGCTA